MPFTVLPASSADAHEIASLLRRSIVELCAADHGGNPETYAPWLANKTPENVENWIQGPERVNCAIDERRTVLGVAMGAQSGEVHLNYVLPEARFCGVSKMLMRDLEDYFRHKGLEKSWLTSTRTAERFYRSIGYQETGEIVSHRGVRVLRFEKELG